MEVPSAFVHGGVQDVGYLISACWVTPTWVWERVGLLDEEIFYAPEDVDWCVRCHAAGLRVVRVHGEPMVHHYQRISKRRMISRMNWEHVKGLVYYFRKHRYLFDASKAQGVGANGYRKGRGRPIRVLHVLSSLAVRSGVLSVVENYHKYIDPADATFDFVYFFELPDNRKDEVEARGSRTFFLPLQSSKCPFHAIEEFFAEHDGEWDIVHCHTPFAPQALRGCGEAPRNCARGCTYAQHQVQRQAYERREELGALQGRWPVRHRLHDVLGFGSRDAWKAWQRGLPAAKRHRVR